MTAPELKPTRSGNGEDLEAELEELARLPRRPPIRKVRRKRAPGTRRGT